MKYRVTKGTTVVAVQHDGYKVGKIATKEKLYETEEPLEEVDGFYTFPIKNAQYGLYREFRISSNDIEILGEYTPPPDGTYAVIFTESEHGTGYATIKLETSRDRLQDNGKENFFYGKQIISYLSGPDNETNFMGFAHVDENGIAHIWRRFRGQGMEKYVEALTFLVSGGAEKLGEAGLMYAVRSGRCYRCNLKLTVPASLHAGMGPICRQKATI